VGRLTLPVAGNAGHIDLSRQERWLPSTSWGQKLNRAFWPRKCKFRHLRETEKSVEIDPAFRQRWSKFTPSQMKCAESSDPAVATWRLIQEIYGRIHNLLGDTSEVAHQAVRWL
jgi:hypothetical protein